MAGVVGVKGKLHVRDIYAETAKKDRPREGPRSKYFSLKEQSRLRALKRETGGRAGIRDAAVTILITKTPEEGDGGDEQESVMRPSLYLLSYTYPTTKLLRLLCYTTIPAILLYLVYLLYCLLYYIYNTFTMLSIFHLL